MKVLRRLPNIDAKHLAIAGHSAGGVAALEFAARNPEVTVVLGLDGSYGFLPEPHRTEEVMRALNGLHVGQVRAFLLDMRRADGVQGAKLDSTVVDRMVRSDRYLVTFMRMFHGDFTEFGTIGLKLSVPLRPTGACPAPIPLPYTAAPSAQTVPRTVSILETVRAGFSKT